MFKKRDLTRIEYVANFATSTEGLIKCCRVDIYRYVNKNALCSFLSALCRFMLHWGELGPMQSTTWSFVDSFIWQKRFQSLPFYETCIKYGEEYAFRDARIYFVQFRFLMCNGWTEFLRSIRSYIFSIYIYIYHFLKKFPNVDRFEECNLDSVRLSYTLLCGTRKLKWLTKDEY